MRLYLTFLMSNLFHIYQQNSFVTVTKCAPKKGGDGIDVSYSDATVLYDGNIQQHKICFEGIFS